ncbi:MAG: phosphoribosylanthranilate isomerase [Pseudanabaenaceae cyanobacterium bins.68]|nr:phosphoribosylanthranilate isomerase [Pseudanabaenaceae cyanobacterium bins.68]
MYLKICGITRLDQAIAIAHLEAVTALGFIYVPGTPRYLNLVQIHLITTAIAAQRPIDLVGVGMNLNLDQAIELVHSSQINSLQLHGQESPNFCGELKAKLPQIRLVKAFRISDRNDLAQIPAYLPYVDQIILDAYHPHLAGGTGQTLDWALLADFAPGCPWLLAGGLTPENVAQAIAQTQPDGIDLSSGVEHQPGDKNLNQIGKLIAALP